MDAFSYLSVLLSIVLGLGLTQVLAATGRLIRHRDRVQADWLPILWAAVLVLVYVQVWWAMFGLRAVREWTFLSFLVVLAQTVLLYMMAAVVLPESVEEERLDLGEHYSRQHRWFFAFFVATLAVSVLKDRVVAGQLPGPLNLAFHGVLAAIGISAVIVHRRRYHELAGIVGAITVVAYIAVLFTRLQ